jgi:hypothetical protein
MEIIDKAYGSVLEDPFFGICRKSTGVLCDTKHNLLDGRFENTSLANFYEFVPNIETETKINQWTFLSIEKIQKNNNTKMIDFGIKYEGMGFVVVLYYIIDNQNFAIRIDGGSNDIDRREHFNQYNNKDYQPKDFKLFKGDIIELELNNQYTLEDLKTFFNLK